MNCKALQCFHHFPGIVECQDGTDGKTEFLTVNALGDGQRQLAPFAVALLTVGWDGVVDECLYAVLREVLLQLVAARAEDGEGVIDVLCIVGEGGQCQQRMLDVAVVIGRYALTLSVVVVEIAQLDAEHGSL